MGKKSKGLIVYDGMSLPFYEAYPIKENPHIFSDNFGKMILYATRSWIWWALCRYDCKGFKHVGIACRYGSLNEHSTSWVTKTIYTRRKMKF